MRIGISISRTYRDYDMITDALLDACEDVPRHEKITLVHGASGMDWFVAGAAHMIGMIPEDHPADWAQHGKPAGMIRNRRMVDLGADLWIAWADPCAVPFCKYARPHPTHGTGECVKLAERAGIPVMRRGDGWGTPHGGGAREESQS